MFKKLQDEKLIVEIASLVNNIENIQEDIDSYCEFMKGVILNTSGLN